MGMRRRARWLSVDTVCDRGGRVVMVRVFGTALVGLAGTMVMMPLAALMQLFLQHRGGDPCGMLEDQPSAIETGREEDTYAAERCYGGHRALR